MSGKHEQATKMRHPSFGMENMIAMPLFGGSLGVGCSREASKQTGPFVVAVAREDMRIMSGMLCPTPRFPSVCPLFLRLLSLPPHLREAG